MRHLFLLLLISFMSYGQEGAPLPITTVEFETKTIDYGTIEKGSDGKKMFYFKNTGNHPLVISKVFSSSYLKVLDYPKEAVDVGEEKSITISYDTNNVGPIVKTITVQMNVEEKVIALKLKGRVN